MAHASHRRVVWLIQHVPSPIKYLRKTRISQVRLCYNPLAVWKRLTVYYCWDCALCKHLQKAQRVPDIRDKASFDEVCGLHAHKSMMNVNCSTSWVRSNVCKWHKINQSNIPLYLKPWVIKSHLDGWCIHFVSDIGAEKLGIVTLSANPRERAEKLKVDQQKIACIKFKLTKSMPYPKQKNTLQTDAFAETYELRWIVEKLRCHFHCNLVLSIDIIKRIEQAIKALVKRVISRWISFLTMVVCTTLIVALVFFRVNKMLVCDNRNLPHVDQCHAKLRSTSGHEHL